MFENIKFLSKKLNNQLLKIMKIAYDENTYDIGLSLCTDIDQLIVLGCEGTDEFIIEYIVNNKDYNYLFLNNTNGDCSFKIKLKKDNNTIFTSLYETSIIFSFYKSNGISQHDTYYFYNDECIYKTDIKNYIKDHNLKLLNKV